MTAQAPREAFASLGRTSWTRVVTIAAAGLLLRVVVRLYSGEADFWQNGYSFLFELAHNVAAGHGLAFDAPYLNPGSTDTYEFPPASVIDRK